MDKQTVVYMWQLIIIQPLKRNEILLHATTWMTLSEIRDTKGQIHDSTYILDILYRYLK